MGVSPECTELGLSEAVATIVTSHEFADAVDAQRDHVTDVLLDTIAVCAEAAMRPGFRPVAETMCGGTGGPATLIGSPGGTSAVAAAIYNGMTANSTLLAEGHRVAGGHPAAHIVPAVLAAAEVAGASGELLLRALAAGYEVAVRVGAAVVDGRPGLSPNGNWGTIGAAAGVAYLAGGAAPSAVGRAIDASSALALHGPMAFGYEGAESYRLFVGLGAGAALSAGLGAAAGWEAPTGTLSGWFAGQHEDASPEPPVFDGDPAIGHNYFKRYGTCAHTQAALDAACALRTENGLDPHRDAVVGVEVRCGSRAAAALPLHSPRNAFAARYNIPLMTAVAWWYGPDALLFLDDDAWCRPEVRATAALTSVAYDERLATGAATGRPTAVTVRLADGRCFERLVQVPHGDAQDPFSRTELRRKANVLLGRAHSSSWAAAVATAVDHLTDVGPSRLTAALRSCDDSLQDDPLRDREVAVRTVTAERAVPR